MLALSVRSAFIRVAVAGALFACSTSASAARYNVSLTGTVQSVPAYISSVAADDSASWDFVIDDSVPSGDITFSETSTLTYTGQWRYHAAAIIGGTVRVGDSVVLPYLPEYFTVSVGSTVQNDWTLERKLGGVLVGPQDGITFSGGNVDDPMNPLLNIDGNGVFRIYADVVDPSQTALGNANLADALSLGFAGFTSGSMQIDLAAAAGPGDQIWIALDEWSVAPVPVPAAVWLFAGALVSLVGIARRRNRGTVHLIANPPRL